MYTKEEQKLRRQLTKLGYSLMKRNDGYMIADVYRNVLVAGWLPEFSMSLEDVEEWLQEE